MFTPTRKLFKPFNATLAALLLACAAPAWADIDAQFQQANAAYDAGNYKHAGDNRMQEHRQRMEHGQAIERRMERNREQMGQRSRQFERNERREQRFGYEERTSERGGYSRISVPSPWRN